MTNASISDGDIGSYRGKKLFSITLDGETPTEVGSKYQDASGKSYTIIHKIDTNKFVVHESFTAEEEYKYKKGIVGRARKFK